jgi:uncharacterized protein
MSGEDSRIAYRGEILFRKSTSLSNPHARYQGFSPGEQVLKAGTIMREGARPLPCDILFQRDIPVTLRDGTTIYTDVFRPITSEEIPGIVAWSPYGKNLGGFHLDDFPFRMAVPQSLVSELNKWEAPDPAIWCAKGYAVINPDARGAYSSDGNEWCWSRQEGLDGADLVDWVGGQDWCSGRVGLAGNSWLAASQWFIAAERPKHLAAIAPWEGLSDVYKNLICAGGIPEIGFMDDIINRNAGKNEIEDLIAMLERYPLYNDYWRDHSAAIEDIDVPAYVVASLSSLVHVNGTFEAFERLKSEKWLRVHHIQEWPDFYDPTNQEDLGRFFDRYLKGHDNGWEATPKVRLSVFSVGPDNATVTNRAESNFPVERTRYRSLHLGATSSSEAVATPPPSTVTISAEKREAASFDIAIDERIELVGYPELVLYAHAKGTDDFDLFVRLQKLNVDGTVFDAMTLPEDSPIIRAHREEVLAARNMPFKYVLFYQGPWSRLRASLRAIDPKKSRPGKPFLSFDRTELLAEGEIAELRFGLTPIAMELKPGETLRVIVETWNELQIPFGERHAQPIGRGEVVIHCGGSHASHLVVPDTTRAKP